MPIYEYKCNSCEHTFSLLQKMGATTEGLACPNCRSVEIKKMMSASTVATMEGKLNDFNWTPPKAPPGVGSCGSGGCSSGMCGM